MGKIEQKKQKKRRDILNAAYDLFTTVGFHSTTILGIALRAGVGKGTFYLYFKNKEEVRDELIMLKSSQLLLEATSALREELTGTATLSVADQFIYIADYIISVLRQDIVLLKFISKNLTWGTLAGSKRFHTVDDEVLDFADFILSSLEREGVLLRNPGLLLFTLLELVNSTCYNTLLYNDPVPFDQYKPYLYESIRRLVEADLA